MDEFLRDIKNNLENRPEAEFDPAGWADMEERMKEPESPTKGMIAWWWLPASLLPILLLNFMYLSKEATTVETKIITELQTDTIYKTQLVYQTDTVFQTKIKYQRVEVPVKSARFDETLALLEQIEKGNQEYVADFLASKNSTLFVHSGDMDSENSLGVVSGDNTKSGDSFGGNSGAATASSQNELEDKEGTDNSIAEEMRFGYDFSQIEGIENLPISFLEIGNEVPENMLVAEVVKRKKSREQRWFETKEMMRPNGFRLGTNGSVLLPAHQNLENTYGYFGGVSAMIDYSKNFRLIGDFSYGTLNLISENPDDSFGLPGTIPAVDPSFVFDKAIADQQSIEVGLGFQYLFNTKRSVKPYLGVSYNVLFVTPYEVEYFFDDALGAELTSPREVSGQGLIKNLGLVNAGVEIDLYKNIQIQTEAFYRRSMDTKGILTPNVYGLKARLMYNF